ncbi:MAG: DNA topoisomerase I [Staphylothermus sp.]|nr:DNA topoisomerase I [Staphylothermus sp.]
MSKTILDYLKKVSEKKEEKEKVSEIKKEEVKIKVSIFDTTRKKYSLKDLTGKIVVIAEKPKAARKIALALASKPLVKKTYGIPYYIINNKMSKIIIASAAGHLYGLHTNKRGYPVFSYEWRPLHEIVPNAKYTEKFIKLLDKVCKTADYYINACDYDIEGSVIGYLIIYFHGSPEKALRAKFSSLTTTELRTAFNSLTSLDWEMIEAGLCRHELDWIWGINISRALMSSVKSVSGKKVVLSAGRVQTPTLRHVVEHEIERNLFIPIPSYLLSIYIIKNNEKYHPEYKGEPIDTFLEASSLAKTIREAGYLRVIKYEEKHTYLHPPPAFNLGDLQEEAARIYRFSPYKTQSIAEKLYLDALISYPRTNSQKLPPTLNYRGILEKIRNIPSYSQLVDALFEETKGVLKPVQGPKDDPAHPAIYPTGVKPVNLKPDEWKIYDLIVRRFMAAFAPKAELVHRSVVFKPIRETSKNIVFQLTGQKILFPGWLKYYLFSKPYEAMIPSFRLGEEVPIHNVRVRRTYNKPPEKITKIKILRWMENVGIGTEATRARIIELLFKRGYLRSVGGKVEATNLGLGVIEILIEHFPEITSVELTRYFEEEMERIRRGERKRSDVVENAKKTLISLINSFEEKKTIIGKLLSYRLGLIAPEKKCLLCNREEYRNGLCKYHYQAVETLKQKYIIWKEKEGVSWNEYLKNIRKLKSTGKWIREIIENNSISMKP